MAESLPTTTHAAAAAMVLVALLGACATPAPAPTPAAGTPPPVSASPAPHVKAAVPPPAPVPGPELSPLQAKAQAQRLAVEAVDQLQNGDEAGAGTTLEKALELDAGNELARKLVEQIRADAEKDLGTTSFNYTVQRDDSLSKLAQQFLGDRYRFYILAKYNGIANPSRVAVGQVIRIPGKAPPVLVAAPAPGARATTELEPKPVVAAVTTPQGEASGLMAKGIALQAAGDLEGAYIAFSEAVRKDPGNRDAAMQRNSARTALIRRYEREAAQAFQRQNLDLAIAKWNRVLELDPNHPKARLERERALDLNRKMAEKFGSR